MSITNKTTQIAFEINILNITYQNINPYNAQWLQNGQAHGKNLAGYAARFLSWV